MPCRVFVVLCVFFCGQALAQTASTPPTPLQNAAVIDFAAHQMAVELENAQRQIASLKAQLSALQREIDKRNKDAPSAAPK